MDRIRYTGKPVHLPKSIRVKKDVVEIGFYEALDPNAVNSLSQFKFGAWNLKWSFNYGSPEIPVKDLELKKVELTGRWERPLPFIFQILKPVHMAQIDYDIKSAKGEEIKGRIDHTIHVVNENPATKHQKCDANKPNLYAKRFKKWGICFILLKDKLLLKLKYTPTRYL